LLDPIQTRDSLALLKSRSADIFGAKAHGFLLNPVASDNEIVDFQQKLKIVLPADYRQFLTLHGNGGAGPYYGVFPLGVRDGNGACYEPWHNNDGLVGDLALSFPHTVDWNDLTGLPPDKLMDEDSAHYHRQLDEFEKRYWGSAPVNGAIPICHEGCAIRIWLVVTGSQAGYVWRDTRAEYAGLHPLRAADGTQLTFSAWYSDWLITALRKAGL
jgi:hypothetical protein